MGNGPSNHGSYYARHTVHGGRRPKIGTPIARWQHHGGGYEDAGFQQAAANTLEQAKRGKRLNGGSRGTERRRYGKESQAERIRSLQTEMKRKATA